MKKDLFLKYRLSIKLIGWDEEKKRGFCWDHDTLVGPHNQQHLETIIWTLMGNIRDIDIICDVEGHNGHVCQIDLSNCHRVMMSDMKVRAENDNNIAHDVRALMSEYERRDVYERWNFRRFWYDGEEWHFFEIKPGFGLPALD